MQHVSESCYGQRALRLFAVIALCVIISCFPVWADAESLAPAPDAGGTNTLKLQASNVAHVINEAARCVAFTVFSNTQPEAGVGFWIATSGLNAEVKNEVRYPIAITSSSWQHIMDRHTVGGSKNAGTSIFNPGLDIRALIRQTEVATPVLESNGYYSREFDAGRNIGYEGRNGKQTSIVRVITTQSGKLVTAYPVVQ